MELDPAQQLMASGYNCAESVLLAACRQMGIEDALVPRLATAFGGGMARTGEVCGAVTGALMAIGARCGRDEAEQSREEAYAPTRRFLLAFAAEMGSLRCRDLTGIDMTTEQGMQQYRGSDVLHRVCLPAVGFAYQRTLGLLSQPM